MQPLAPVTSTRINSPPGHNRAATVREWNTSRIGSAPSRWGLGYAYRNRKIKHISTAVMEANFDWTIVKVETDENITGYGEAFLGPGLTAVIREFSAIL